MMLRRLVLAAVALAIPSAAWAETAAWRAFVSDREAGTVHVIDLEAQAMLAPLSFDAPVVLAPSGTASLLFAADRGNGRVYGLAAGIGFEAHGDHFDLKVETPRLLGLVAEGPKPSHVTPFGGRTALYFDGQGAAAIVADRDVLDGKPVPVKAGDGPPHHGVAVAHRAWTAVTLTADGLDGPVATGVRLLKADGSTLSESRDCPALHGEAAAPAFVVFGCADGVLVAFPDGSFRKHLYPDGRPEDARIWMTEKASGFTMTVGDFGRAHISVLEPTTGALTFHPLASPMVALALDPENGARVFVACEDGSVRLYDALTGAERGVRPDAVTPMAELPEGSRLRPRLTVAGPHLIVTDPAKGEAVHLSAGDLSPVARYALGGVPASAVAVGGVGESH